MDQYQRVIGVSSLLMLAFNQSEPPPSSEAADEWRSGSGRHLSLILPHPHPPPQTEQARATPSHVRQPFLQPSCNRGDTRLTREAASPTRATGCPGTTAVTVLAVIALVAVLVIGLYVVVNVNESSASPTI